MIIFILIFFAVILTVGAAAVLGFSFYLKRRTAKSLAAKNQTQICGNAPPPYRSLFEPDDEELRALELEERARVEAESKENERKISFEKSEQAREFEKIWRNKPNRQNTIEFLRLAAMSESAEIFSQTAESVIQVCRNEQAGALSNADLADLLDSHFRTLPQQARFSGAIFWLKQEIQNLRAESKRL